MKKKDIKPTTTVVEMKQQRIICTSMQIYDETYTTDEQW